jgi:hypothetical protein
LSNTQFTVSVVSNLAGKAGQTNVNDDSALQNLASMLKSFLSELSKGIEGSIEKGMSTLLKEALSKSGGSASDSDISSISESVAQEIGAATIKIVTDSIPKNPGQKNNSDDTALKSIYDNIDKLSKKVAEAAAGRIEQHTNIKVDPSTLSPGISSVLKTALPSSTATAARDTTNAVSIMKDIFREGSRIADSISSMRKSGGKVDSTEIGSVLSGSKKIISDFS